MATANHPPSPSGPAPILGPGHDFATVTDKISSLVLTTKTPLGWFVIGSVGCAAVSPMPKPKKPGC